MTFQHALLTFRIGSKANADSTAPLLSRVPIDYNMLGNPISWLNENYNVCYDRESQQNLYLIFNYTF